MVKRMLSFSGGAGSFLSAVRTIERHGRDGLELVFCDTLAEDCDLYRFNRDAEAFLGMKLTVLCEGRTPFQTVFDKRYLNGSRADCSRLLKGKMLDAHAVATQPDIRVIGIDWSESSRLEDIREKLPQWTWEAPMIEPPRLTKEGMLFEIRRLGLEPPQMYAEGYEHNNCAGSCLKAGIGHWKHHLKARPAEFAKSEAQENEFRQQYGDFAILRDRRGGKTVPLPLSELRRRVESNETPSLFDDEEWGGCGCALNVEGDE